MQYTAIILCLGGVHINDEHRDGHRDVDDAHINGKHFKKIAYLLFDFFCKLTSVSFTSFLWHWIRIRFAK